jgi:hypothetical protein
MGVLRCARAYSRIWQPTKEPELNKSVFGCQTELVLLHQSNYLQQLPLVKAILERKTPQLFLQEADVVTRTPKDRKQRIDPVPNLETHRSRDFQLQGIPIRYAKNRLGVFRTNVNSHSGNVNGRFDSLQLRISAS